MSKETLAFLKKLHDRSIELLRDLKFDKRLHKDGYVVCLYASMLELCGGIIVLVDRDLKTAVSPVFRTLLEAYVDFVNAHNDPTYVGHSFARHHKDWIKVLNAGGSNRFLSEIHEHEDRDASLKRHTTELERLRAEGIDPLKIDERFRRAGMSDEYVSIYHFESDKTHNSWQALIGRHFMDAEDDFGLALYKDRGPESFNTYLDSAASLLLDATEKIHARLGSQRRQEISHLRDEFDKIRGDLIAELGTQRGSA